MVSLEELFEELTKVIVSAKKSMFSSADVTVNKKQVLDIVDEMRRNYPDIIKEAQYIQNEGERLLAEAHERAQQIIAEAERRQRQLLDESDLVKQAEAEAEQIRADAMNMRDRVEYDVKVKIDQMLKESELTLTDALMLIRNNREELRGSMVKK